MSDISSAQRLLKLKEILFYETDEDHELAIHELVDKVTAVFGLEYKVDQRALKRDIEALNNQGFEVIENQGKYGKIFYSHQTRLFETYQLRLLADAVLSARFITEAEKKTLIRKLKKLTSNHIAKSMPDPLIFQQSSNLDYNLIKLHIDKVHKAVSEQRVIHFQYGMYNVQKQFILRRDGEVYEVYPYALIWHHDYYYLIGQYYQEFRHYRLDRMRNVTVTEKRFKKEAFNATEYVHHSFNMYSGKEEWVKIQFHNDLINLFIDRFGLEADIKTLDEEHCVLTTKAKISEGLVKWILTLGSKAKVLQPDSLVEMVREEIYKMNQLYT
ncbi:hypothetical protein AT864_03078 [Anoxybacillus sp. P3H1B]|uniref:helix-turn-helix transcriptional regulator n=1 Tax=Anoxybacillus sp. P3H1B TaxID=1769293 RepID=UPI000798C418|nr:WYL domain-containing protein [Anoxybacillus sp. P3H1B]KXG08661.1 hypothetical protein AT864_03078 [Anoxybacillus sp. P3H1B]